MSASAYAPEPGCFDEAFDAEGEARPHYRELLEALEQDLEGLSRRVAERVGAHGLTFGEGEEIAVDPVPRLLTAAEWERLEAGLLQRARALKAQGRAIIDLGVACMMFAIAMQLVVMA